MPDIAVTANLLFLREEDLQQGLELLFFAERDLGAEVDPLLTERGLTPIHHRVLHFVGRQPQITMTEILNILRVSKQALSRVTQDLTARDLVSLRIGQRDRRQRQLALTEAGRVLERALWERQRARLNHAYRKAGGQAVEGFRQVLGLLIADAADRARFGPALRDI